MFEWEIFRKMSDLQEILKLRTGLQKFTAPLKIQEVLAPKLLLSTPQSTYLF